MEHCLKPFAATLTQSFGDCADPPCLIRRVPVSEFAGRGVSFLKFCSLLAEPEEIGSTQAAAHVGHFRDECLLSNLIQRLTPDPGAQTYTPLAVSVCL